MYKKAPHIPCTKLNHKVQQLPLQVIARGKIKQQVAQF